MEYHNPMGSYASGYNYTGELSDLHNYAGEQSSLQVQQFKQITGIEDLANISSKEFQTVQELAGEGTLDQNSLAAAIRYIPNYFQLQKEGIQTLRTIVEKASSNQAEAWNILRSIQNSLDAQSRTLEDLARSAQTDATRLQLAMVTIEIGRQQIELAKIVAQVNSDNNKLYLAAAGIGALALAAGAAIIRGLLSDREQT